jgi:hypothetical protein
LPTLRKVLHNRLLGNRLETERRIPSTSAFTRLAFPAVGAKYDAILAVSTTPTILLVCAVAEKAKSVSSVLLVASARQMMMEAIRMSTSLEMAVKGLIPTEVLRRSSNVDLTAMHP